MEWLDSIHSYSEIRSGIIEFQDAYIQRDEVAAEKVLKQYALRADRWNKPMVVRHRHRWFVHAVGYLMLAVMPRRDDDDMTTKPSLTENPWSPSIEARRFADSKNKAPWVLDAVGNNRYGSFTTGATKRHVPLEEGQKGLGNRKTLLEKLQVETTIRETASEVPPDIVETFWAALRQASADAAVTDDKDWLPNFNLKIRGWKSSTNEGHVGEASASQVTEYNGPEPMQYEYDEAASQPSSEEARGAMSAQRGVASLPGQSTTPPASTAEDTAPNQPRKLKYYTIGEVGNHRFRSDLWAIVDDGLSGFDIYDVSGRFYGLAMILHRDKQESVSPLLVH